MEERGMRERSNHADHAVDARTQFIAFLEHIWMDNTEEDALAMWEQRVLYGREEAGRDLAALDSMVANPPTDLVALMEEHGWIHLVHRPDRDTMTPYSFEEY